MVKKAISALSIAGLLSIGVAGLGAPPVNAFGLPEHRNITHAGLMAQPGWEFLHWPVVDDISDEHAKLDAGPPFSNNGGQDEFHFDDCEFDGAAAFIRDRYRAAQDALVGGDLFAVGDYFGMALHPAQDFYSHSNWVELGFPRTPDNPATPVIEVSQSDLVDISGAQRSFGSPWDVPVSGEPVREDILLANDDWSLPPGSWKIIPEGAGRHQSVLIRPDGTRAGRLLETGKGSGDDECNVTSDPDEWWSVVYGGFSHPELNKDDRNKQGFEKARALAVLQTSYEWCRLVSEAGKVDRDGLLLAMWVRPGANPHPPNTPCSNTVGLGLRRHPVTVTIERIKVLHTGDSPSDLPGEIQVSAALYDDPQNFHASAHEENRGGRMILNPGDTVPSNQLPEPLTVCVRYGTQVNFAVHGWDNSEDARDRYATVYDDYGDDDELLMGGRIKFDSEVASGSHVARWEDLEVRYRVTTQPGGETPVSCGRNPFGPPPTDSDRPPVDPFQPPTTDPFRRPTDPYRPTDPFGLPTDLFNAY
jgi:hypothetical protein